MLIQSDRKDVAMGGMVATREFGMKAGSHLMSILSGLYENPTDAMVREYLTNMYDACLPILKAGGSVLNPILRLPSKLNPKLEFQDFGIGMDFDTVWKVYAEYGNSTKSDTNDAVGGFGLGSKTAFCYNDGAPWNIVATKDGVTNRFMAFIGENGAPTMTHIMSSETNEPNGVTVSIPIRMSDVESVLLAAKKYIPFFPIPLTVENLDEVPEPIQYLVKGKTWGIIKATKDHYSNRSLTVVMGNVPYDVDIRSMFNLGWYADDSKQELTFGMNNDMVIEVPIGSVDVTPSRDSLKVTDRTKATIRSMLKDALSELPSIVDAMIDGATTKWEKIELRYELLNSLSLPDAARTKIDESGIGSTLRVAVPIGAEVTSFKLVDTHKATPMVTENEAEFQFRPGTFKNKGVSVVIVNDTKKPISGMCREYVRKNFCNFGYSGRVASYGHSVSNVYSVKLPSNVSVDTFTKTLEGFTNVILASDLVGQYVTPRAVRVAGSVVYTENNGKFNQRIATPTGATEYHYVVLNKSTDKSRYTFSNPKGEFYNLRAMAKGLGVFANLNTTIYGVRDVDVASLPSEWIDVEVAIADALIDKLQQNKAMVGVDVDVKHSKRIEFLRAMGDLIPEGKTLAKEYDDITKKETKYWDVLGRELRDVEWSVRKPHMDRINLEIAAIKANNTQVAVKDFDAESKRIIEQNEKVQMMYDVYATPTYHITTAVAGILKKYLATT